MWHISSFICDVTHCLKRDTYILYIFILSKYHLGRYLDREIISRSKYHFTISFYLNKIVRLQSLWCWDECVRVLGILMTRLEFVIFGWRRKCECQIDIDTLFMHVDLCVYKHMCTYVYMYTHIYNKSTNIHIHVNIFMYLYKYTRTHIHVYKCMLYHPINSAMCTYAFLCMKVCS